MNTNETQNKPYNPKDYDDVHIYDLEWLQTHEYTSEDFEDETLDGNIYCSIVVNMWKFAGKSEDTDEILKIMRTNPRWMYENTWTLAQRKEYEKIVVKILTNYFGGEDYKEEAEHEAQIFSAFGAFNLDNYDDLRKELEEMEDLEVEISEES